MKQEYLILNNTQKEDIEAFAIDGIEVKVEKFSGIDSWKMIYAVAGENKKSARKLSLVQNVVLKKFELTTLLNDSSEYFNRNLYSLVSIFERKLRKLLYLYNLRHLDEESTKNIDNLESKDFGNIFDMLFIDPKFVKNVKEKINNKNYSLFTKDDIVKLITDLEEEPNWDKLLGKETVPTLRKQFDKIRLYRNDVMHSHNIDFEKYKSIKKLYLEVNRELDIAIEKVDRTTLLTPTTEELSISLSQAINSWEEQMNNIDFSPVIKAIDEMNAAFNSTLLYNAIKKYILEASILLENEKNKLEWTEENEEDSIIENQT